MSSVVTEEAKKTALHANKIVKRGTCCLSNVSAPLEVPHLNVLKGSDDSEYLVSDKCIRKYSRQLYVFGIAAMARMMHSNVLVSGLSGLGLEICKNVILAGVKSFYIHDPSPVTFNDLSSHFYANASDIKHSSSENGPVSTTRAEAAFTKLKELNDLTPVQIFENKTLVCDDSGIGMFTVVVIVDGQEEDLKRISSFCHQKGICFVATGSYGLYGYAFSDFGEQFTVSDNNGENPKTGIVCGIEFETNLKNTIVIETDKDSRHGLSENDWVRLSGFGYAHFENSLGAKTYQVQPIVRIVTEGNRPPRKIRDQTMFRLTLDNVHFQELKNHCDRGSKSGYWTEAKQPTSVCHTSFCESFYNDAMDDSKMVITDYSDVQKPKKLAAYLRALLAFQKSGQGHLPRPGNVSDAKVVVEHALNIFRKSIKGLEPKEFHQLIDSTEQLLMTLTLGSRGSLNPMAALFGGVVGQEVIKACSGKYMPLNQWLHFDSAASLPRLWSREEGAPLEEADVQPLGCRYDGQVVVFGRSFQQRLNNASIFLVGAGALGCEYLKNFAMTGLGTREIIDENNKSNGRVVVTDMDTVEISNLNRQFLFRDKNIGEMKSVAAAAAARTMNPSLNFEGLGGNSGVRTTKVAPETESTFNDDFWDSIDVVVNALDNVDARKYVDSRCRFYKKPLLESGTLGTKANVQPIVPHVTQGYSEGPEDQDEGDIPVCTLKSFPYLIEHTLAWAQDKFYTEFVQKPTQALQYLNQGKDLYLEEIERSSPNSKLKYLRYIESMRGRNAPATIEDCVRWARLLFEDCFKNTIEQLLVIYPKDKVVGGESVDKPTKFWNGRKKCPIPIRFDSSNPLHIDFIKASAYLRANIFCLTQSNDEAIDIFDALDLETILASVEVPEFSPNKSLKVASSEQEAKEFGGKAVIEDVQESDLAKLYSELLASIEDVSLENRKECKYTIDEFEKDDDSNFHMSFVTATSNIRATSYGIPQADKMRSTQIVGRIIPAVATTTALATGAAMFELYKLFFNAKKEKECKNIEAFRSSNFNLAINLFCQFEPAKPERLEFCGKEFTSWDAIETEKDMTLEEFRNWFEETYGSPLSLIATAGTNPVTIYNDFLDDELIDQRSNVKLSKLVKDISGCEENELAGKKYMMLTVDIDEESDDESSDEDSNNSEESLESNEKFVPDVRIRIR
jgi:ubiquitin-activating enzyme E1